jgi:hypothetical protein
MKLAGGTENFNCDVVPVRSRGCSLTDAELDIALQQRLPDILEDQPGTARIKTLLEGLATTGFAENRLKEILVQEPTMEAWRVGEALAEAYLVDHRQCEFPWPAGRDLRNPSASSAGADLAGFDKRDAKTRFAFGEVKTSEEENSPPGVVTGRHGLSKQIEGLRNRRSIKNPLVRYLAHRAKGAPWESTFKDAARVYLKNSEDVSLFGVLVRDVSPNVLDLKSRSVALAKGCPTATRIELRALYLPKGCLKAIVKRAAAAKAKGGKK